MQDNSVRTSGPRNVPMLVLSYLGVLALIPLLAEPNDPEVQKHAKHGIVMMVAEILLLVALSMLIHIPLLGFIIGCGTFPFIGIGLLVLHIAAILKALRGEMIRLPFLTEIAENWK